MRTQITNYRNLPINTIFTALVRTVDSGEGGEDDLTIKRGPAVSPSVMGHLVAAVGTVGFLTKREVIVKNKKRGTTRREIRRRLYLGDSERFESKDRNGLFGEYIDAPDVSEMLAMIYKGGS